MSPMVCANCGALVRDPYQQTELRMEWRRKKDQGRYRVAVIGHWCTTCADERADSLQGKNEHPEALSLWNSTRGGG